mgnify:FL=1|tara:strand:- start:11112 stop:12272 length:1161 start_codon:yes stop_codon:yes gene_type:complete
MFNTRTLTAFSHTKAKWKRYPIIETTNMDDYSVVKQYKNTYPYVWIKNTNYEILETFNWNYTPNEETSNQIHCFPLCHKVSKRPISWDILKLVPTSVTTETKIYKSTNIASYEKYITPIYFYSFQDHQAIKKFKKHTVILETTSCHLIHDKLTFDDVIDTIAATSLGSPVWAVNIDVKLENLKMLSAAYASDMIALLNADMVMFATLHQSTGTCYADNSAVLISPNFLHRMSSNKLIKDSKRKMHIESINDQIGYINDVTDPYKAWANAYATCLTLHNTNIKNLNKQKNKLLNTYTGLPTSRVNEFIKAGIQQAEKDRNLDTFNFDEFMNWGNILKRYQNWNNKTTSDSTSDVMKKRLARTLAVYGKNSDEYQKLSSQLGKSSLSL